MRVDDVAVNICQALLAGLALVTPLTERDSSCFRESWELVLGVASDRPECWNEVDPVKGTLPALREHLSSGRAWQISPATSSTRLAEITRHVVITH